jgi:hypothetical protein
MSPNSPGEVPPKQRRCSMKEYIGVDLGKRKVVVVNF